MQLDYYVRFEVLTAVKMMMFFWDVMPCELIGRHHCFSPEDRGSIFL
jgi:hypothetical protein